MSGRAGRTGFDTRGDVVIVTNQIQQMKHTRNFLLQPFTTKLSSALFGSRLVRALLEIVASQAVQSLSELSTFIESTLIFQLTKQDKCGGCENSQSSVQKMFKSNQIGDYLAQFDVKKFCEMENLNYECRSCLQAFSLDVMAYLRQKHFLIINTKAILPTPLGKAAFASSIAPEESQQIFNDLVEVR